MSDFPNHLLHLICVGVEKCGTTSLHDLFASLNGVLVPRIKETFFFSGNYHLGPKWYTDLFAKSYGQSHTFIDFTPSYFRRKDALIRISEFPTNKKILFLMRNPFSRAWSFYQHDIYHHFSMGQRRANNFDTQSSFAFSDLYDIQDPYYFTFYAKHLKGLQDRFGADSVLPVAIEDVIRDPNQFIMRLSSFAGREFSASVELSLPHSNRLTSPYYLYPEQNDLEVRSSTGWFRLPKKKLYIIRDGIPEPNPIDDENRIANALAFQESWTRQIPELQAQIMSDEMFGNEIENMEEVLGQDLPYWRQQKELSTSFTEFMSVEASNVAPKRFAIAKEQYAI